MGYSIAAPIKSKQLKDTMLSFLNKNFRPFNEVAQFNFHSIHPTDQLNYDHAKLRIGFNYSGLWDTERDYIYSICNWIALKIGRKKNFNGQKLNYIVYDGHAMIPVKSFIKEYTSKELVYLSFYPNWEKQIENIKLELERLDKKWHRTV